MNPASLSLAVERLKDVAASHGGSIRVQLQTPATPSQIAEAAAAVGAPLALSHSDFLSTHDGIDLRLFSEPEGAADPGGIEAYSFIIYGTRDIIARTAHIRTFIESNWEGEEERATELARRFAVIADVLDRDTQIVSVLDRPTAGGEYEIRDVFLDDTSWIDAVSAAPQFILATSFAEFVEKSFAFMFEHELGFCYWFPEILDGRSPSMWGD